MHNHLFQSKFLCKLVEVVLIKMLNKKLNFSSNFCSFLSRILWLTGSNADFARLPMLVAVHKITCVTQELCFGDAPSCGTLRPKEKFI